MRNCWVQSGLIVFLAVSLGACAQNSGDLAGLPDREPVGEIDYGNYVVGRFAGEIGDPRASDFLLRAAKHDPSSQTLLGRTVLTLLMDGRFEEALDLARTLDKQEAGENLSTLLLMLDAFKAGKHDKAESYLSKLGSSGFERLLVPISKAWLAAEKGDEDAVLSALVPLANVPAFRSFALSHKAFALDYMGRNEAASKAYLEALQAGRISSLRPVAAYAALLQQMGDEERALKLIEEYRQAFPRNAFLDTLYEKLKGVVPLDRSIATPSGAISLVLYRAANELERDGASRPAIIYLRLASYLTPQMDDLRLSLAQLLGDAGFHQSSLEELNKIGRKDPEFETARLRMAWLHQRSGDMTRAIETLEDYVAEFPESARAWATLGDIYRTEEDFVKSVETYNRAINLNTRDSGLQDWFLYFARGIAHEQLDNWDKAEDDLLKSLSLSADQSQVLNYLGYSWIDRGINLERGTKMIERAVQLRPDDGFIIDSLGWAHYLKGDYEMAVRHLERAVQLEPSDPTINDHLGDAYWKVGRLYEARFQWNHALASNPDPQMKKHVKEKLAFGLELAQADQVE